MARHRIVTLGQSAALLLPQELLAQINVRIGDEIEVSIIDHTLILRSLEEAQRQQHLETIIDQVLTRRKSAYQRLAQGA